MKHAHPSWSQKTQGSHSPTRCRNSSGSQQEGGQSSSWKGLVSFLSASCAPGTCYTCTDEDKRRTDALCCSPSGGGSSSLGA